MPPVVLALPGHAPCTEAEYLVRTPRGAEARSLAIRAAASWAPGESDRPVGWTARYAVGDSVLELATAQVSEGGSTWVLRATSGSDVWLAAGISADGPTSTSLTIGTAYLAYRNGDGGTDVTASGPAVDLR